MDMAVYRRVIQQRTTAPMASPDSPDLGQRQSGWWLNPTPLKNMNSSVGMSIPKIWENKKCSKPPISIDHNLCCSTSHLFYHLHGNSIYLFFFARSNPVGPVFFFLHPPHRWNINQVLGARSHGYTLSNEYPTIIYPYIYIYIYI